MSFKARGGQIQLRFRLLGFQFGLQHIRVGELNPIGFEAQAQTELNQIKFSLVQILNFGSAWI